MNADNSFSVAFDFPFHWGSECRQFIFCFNFPFHFRGEGGVNTDNLFSVGFDFSFHLGGGGGNECRHFIFCWKTEKSNKFVHVLYLLATLFGGCFISQPSRYKEIKRCKLEWNDKKKI